VSATADVAAVETGAKSAGLERGIDWTGAFWVASGVPPLVLFSIGAVAATVGKLSWVIWAASIAMGFIQSFTYAEIAGLFPNKAGGTSIYGAIAWVRYGKLVAPISVWCNWFAWSPVQATGSALAAGYILSGLFAPDAAINTWQLTLLDLGFLKTGLSLRINSVFLLGAVILLAVKFIQDGGILRSANTTKILGISAMIPLLLIGIVPLFTGDIVKANFFPLPPWRMTPWDASPTAPGTWQASRCSPRACSSPPGPPTDSRRPCATPENSRIRKPTPSRPFSIRDCCAWSSTPWCRSRSRVI
jgi:amino acid transporter